MLFTSRLAQPVSFPFPPAVLPCRSPVATWPPATLPSPLSNPLWSTRGP